MNDPMKTQWQPIETAPKDGSLFLAHIITDVSMEDRMDVKVTIAAFDSCLDTFVQVDANGNGYDEDDMYLHWMPVPEPPKQ